MTIPEMLHQVALLTGAGFKREGSTASIEIKLPGGRRQIIYGTATSVRGQRSGLLYTYVGTLTDDIDTRDLLALNAALRYARVALYHKTDIVVLSLFDPDSTSVRDCAPILQEIAAVADELENKCFGADLR